VTFRNRGPVAHKGFELTFDIPDVPETAIDELIDSYIDAVEARELFTGGGWSRPWRDDIQGCHQFVYSDVRDCTADDIAVLVAVLASLGCVNIVAGELKDDDA
jgi:uncharacterized protein YggL (DUF469 family)